MLYNAIGIANVNLRNYAAADEAYQQALAIRTELVGPAHPDVADVLINQARGLAAAGHTDEALALQVKALAIYANNPGSNLDPLRIRAGAFDNGRCPRIAFPAKRTAPYSAQSRGAVPRR